MLKTLISADLLHYWQKMIPAPAQLCMCRLNGPDEYLLRVRCMDAHLDLPVKFDTFAEISLDIEKIGHQLAAMGQLVIPPGGASPNWAPHPQPVLIFDGKYEMSYF